MKKKEAVVIVFLTLVCTFQFATSLLANVSPPNGSVVARSLDAANSVTFECDTFHVGAEGELQQISTTWTLQNFESNRDRSVLVLQSNFEGILLIEGDPSPTNPFSDTFRNRLTVLSFNESLDRVSLSCGTENTGMAHFNLRVYRKPVLVPSLIREVVEGSAIQVDLSSGLEAFPFPAEFQWKKNDLPLDNTSLTLLGYPTAEFRTVSQTDSGLYTLTATNYNLDNPSEVIGGGTGSFQLEVFYGPDFIRGAAEVAFVEGDDAVIVCGQDLASNPPPIIEWVDNLGNTLDMSSGRVTLDSGPLSVSLNLSEVTTSDAGNWTCGIHVQNVQTVQHSIALTVVGPPSVPRGVIIASSGPTWVYLMWEEPVSPGFPPTSVKSYVAMATARKDDNIRYSPAVTDLSVNVTNLLPSTEYEFSVIAQSAVREAVARSQPSSSLSILTTTTVPEIQCPVAPVSEQGVINVTWQYVHTGGLNLSEVALLYSLATQPLQFQLLSNSTPPLEEGQAGDTGSAVFDHLPAGNSYIFEVLSSNGVGSSRTTCPPVRHDIGIPQTPILQEATSSHGEISVELSVAETGTVPGDLFQFHVKTLNTVTLERKNFSFEVRQYRDGERTAFVLSGFVQPELRGEEAVYNVSASCSNRFGSSGDSNQISVVILFNAGEELVFIVAGLGAAGVVAILVLCLIITLFGAHHRKRSEKSKRRYNISEHGNSSAHSSPVSIPRSTKSHQLSNGTSHHYSSMDSIEKAISLCTSIPTTTASHRDETDHIVYDTLLAPPATATSLPPPSPRVAPHIEHLNHSTGHMALPSPLTIPGVNSHTSSQAQLQSSRSRRSVSVPDIVEQLSPDFPAGSSKPISITRDLLELEESYISMHTARNVSGRHHPNGRVRMCEHLRPEYDSDIDNSDF